MAARLPGRLIPTGRTVAADDIVLGSARPCTRYLNYQPTTRLIRKGSIVTKPDNEEPEILDLPVGLAAAGTRREFDSLGKVQVPANRYWGAQTQRSLQHFNIGHDRMPKEVYHAYGYVKKAAAIVNTHAGRLPAVERGAYRSGCATR